MKFKMPEKSLFSRLLRAPWWVSILVAVGVGLAARALLPQPQAGVGILAGFPFVVIGIMAAWRQRHAPDKALVAQALQRCAAMSGTEFAQAIQAAYVSQGYEVTRLNEAAADFRLEKYSRVTVLCCKRWKAASHGVAALSDLEALRQALGAQDATYICLGGVTDNAIRFAKEQGIRLLSGIELAQLFMQK